MTASSGNLLTNGNFAGGTYAGVGLQLLPNGWTYANAAGAAFAGTVETCNGGTTACWVDGSVQSYDALSQTIGTTVGHNYQVTFDAGANGGFNTTYQALSTNGQPGINGNAVDLLTDAQGTPIDLGTTVQAAPEVEPAPAASALTLLAGTLAVLGGRCRKK